ncbi:MAG TPA: Hsp20/alpha crystallin family protein [Gammaproteobacteria bacterium]|nr:Hsp20/alpha crystallin family protein [Gammaproteobacteria bacterium]
MSKSDKGKGVAAAKGGEVQTRQRRALSPWEEMDRLFEDVFSRGWMPRMPRWDWPAWAEVAPPFEGRQPKVDVVERDEDILLKAELPGVDKDDLDVTVTDDSVTIKASTKRESTEEKGDYHRHEIATGTYSRTLMLPSAVKGEQAKATFRNGLLELILPKAAPARRQKVQVE